MNRQDLDRMEWETLVRMDSLYWELARELGEGWRPGAHEPRTMFRDGLESGTWFKFRVCRAHGDVVLVLVSRSFPLVAGTLGPIQCPVLTVELSDAAGAVAKLKEWGVACSI